MKIEQGKYYLVTSDGWFFGPDGEQYKAAWGKAEIVKIDDLLGFVPIRPSTNWFLVLGSGNKSIIIAGCQIHYLVQLDDKPLIKIGVFTEKDSDKTLPKNNVYVAE